MTKREPSKYQLKNPPKFSVNALNDKQLRLIRCIEQYPITVAIGCAGTGKTFTSVGTAVSLFLKDRYERIILARTNVGTGRSIGYLPGTADDKLSYLLMPMLEVIKKAVGEAHYDYLLKHKKILMFPLEYIRGMSFENTLVLVDESQNLTMAEIKSLTTRLGEGSKLVLMGDPHQSDVSNGTNLVEFCKACKRNNIEIPVVVFNEDDIVRSDITADLVRMYYNENL